MAARITSAAIGLPLLLLLVWVGGVWFAALIGAAAALGTLETCRIAKEWGNRPFTVAAVIFAALLILGSYALSQTTEYSRYWPFAVTIASVASIIWLVSTPQRNRKFSKLISTLSAAFYPGGLLFLAPLISAFSQGREWVFFLLAVTFATDTCAFFVGRTIGKHRLAPAISPSKTIEGSIGGIFGAIIMAVACMHLFSLDANLIEVLALGGLVGVIGQVGDLTESRIKRIADVKDSGWIVPGHGGILDRLDSIVFNLVAVFYFVLWIIN